MATADKRVARTLGELETHLRGSRTGRMPNGHGFGAGRGQHAVWMYAVHTVHYKARFVCILFYDLFQGWEHGQV